MVAAEFTVGVLFAAIHAEVLVATEQDLVAQCRFLRATAMQFTGAGDDAVQGNGAAFTGESGGAAPYGADGVTEGPGDEFTGVESRCFLPGQPFNGAASNIESKNVGLFVWPAIVLFFVIHKLRVTKPSWEASRKFGRTLTA